MYFELHPLALGPTAVNCPFPPPPPESDFVSFAYDGMDGQLKSLPMTRLGRPPALLVASPMMSPAALVVLPALIVPVALARLVFNVVVVARLVRSSARNFTPFYFPRPTREPCTPRKRVGTAWSIGEKVV